MKPIIYRAHRQSIWHTPLARGTVNTAWYILSLVVFVVLMAMFLLGQEAESTQPSFFIPKAGAQEREMSLESTVCGPNSVCQPTEAKTAPTVKFKAVGGPVEAEIRKIATETGFQWPDYLVRLATCESRLKPDALGDGAYRSRGIFQISAHYHPTVTDQCAYSVRCATEWTINKINAGQQSLWSCDRLI